MTNIESRWIDIHTCAGLPNVHGDKREDERHKRDGFEPDERFQRHTADPLHVVHGRNAMHYRAENHRPDNHTDQIDEGVAQRLHLCAQ